MCWYITAAVAPKLEATFRARADDAKVFPFAQSNASIREALSNIDRIPRDLTLWAITSGHCSCDLVIQPKIERTVRGPERRRLLAAAATAGIRLQKNVRELFAGLAELNQPLAFVVHTYRGTLEEAFTVTRAPRLTPNELRADPDLPYDAVCIVREIPRHH